MNEYREDLERARARWWATVSTGDLDGYLDLFADDAVWVTPELDEVVGRDAIRDWLEPVFAQFDYELTITVADVRVAGDLGIERARFVSRMIPKVEGFHHGLGAPVGHQDEGVPLPAEGAAVAGPGARDAGPSGDAPDGAEGPEEPLPDDPEPDDGASVGSSVDDAAGEDGSPQEVVPDGGAAAAGPARDRGGPEHRADGSVPPDGAEAGDDEPHEGRYLMYWRRHDDRGWLVHRYADVTGIG